MTNLKLITESDFTLSDYDILIESDKNKPKQIRLRGPYMVAERKNLNERSYPYADLLSECNRFNEEMIKTHRSCGEFEHPPRTNIDFERACHRITSLSEGDDKVFIGESIVLASDPDHGIKGTKYGDLTASLLQYNVKLGMSTRGVGKLEEGIVKNYRLSTVDLVSDPSIGDFVDGILESKDFMIDTHGMICEMSYDKLNNQLDNLPKYKKSEYIIERTREFLNNITKGV